MTCERDHYQHARNDYEAAWPNYCRTCGGLGKTEWEEEYGGVYIDPCETCLEQGKCPRCAGSFDGESDICSHCGWEYDTTEGCPTSTH